MARFAVGWKVRFWDASGVVHQEVGEEPVDADDVHRACVLAGRSVRARFAPPFELSYAVGGAKADATHYHRAEYPAAIPAVDALRARVRAGVEPAAIASELAAGGASPLAVMIAFEHAFGLSLDRHREVVAAGRLDAQILEAQRDWDRPYRLRAARERGDSVADVLHADHADAGPIQLIASLRQAFELDLGDAKQLIERACERAPDFEEMLTAAIDRARARR